MRLTIVYKPLTHLHDLLAMTSFKPIGALKLYESCTHMSPELNHAQQTTHH